ncbi:hypothetical protein BEP19_04330 [Ammoniphilus oxalaticus]|uniref:Methionine aminopeptidase n=1 Tax=Ammoniphilus oxalaticus TaxID=66863 RepID=A0A419SM15_9BACL|nr:methionine aminopeptidase [Ammoniphilus oxalaticus]RKD25056.1 hypothetical protein BEP19_04330 [Ammoniphilus oxalaticus]
MDLLNGIMQWSRDREEKRMARMREQGKCPTCAGRGIDYPIGLSEFVYYPVGECFDCAGSGNYADWAELNPPSDLR